MLKSLTLVTAAVSMVAMAEAIEVDGLVEPYEMVELGSAVPGILETVEVERGDHVKEGQVLATLQSAVEKATMELAKAKAEMEATVESKKAHLEFCRRKEERTRQLFEKETISFNEMDQIQTETVLAEMELQEALETLRLAKLELKQAVAVLDRRIIRSPINGIVVERFLSEGEYVEDQPIYRLAQIDPLNVEVIMPTALFGSVAVGMAAKVIPEEPITGEYVAKVKIVDQVIDAASGTFGVRLEMPNPRLQLPAGLKCTVVFPDKGEKTPHESRETFE